MSKLVSKQQQVYIPYNKKGRGCLDTIKAKEGQNEYLIWEPNEVQTPRKKKHILQDNSSESVKQTPFVVCGGV